MMLKGTILLGAFAPAVLALAAFGTRASSATPGTPALASPLFASMAIPAPLAFQAGPTVTPVTSDPVEPEPVPKFESSTGQPGQPRVCSAFSPPDTASSCSVSHGGTGTCSTNGENGACSSAGGGTNFCSSNGGAQGSQCSTNGNHPSQDCSSAGGSNNQCSAKSAGSCSVGGSGGEGPGEHQTCSSHNSPYNPGGASSTCSAYGAGSSCSVQQGTPNAECTVSRMWPGGGHCSAMDGTGAPTSDGGGTCSVIGGENPEPIKDHGLVCTGDGKQNPLAPNPLPGPGGGQVPTVIPDGTCPGDGEEPFEPEEPEVPDDPAVSSSST